MKLILSRKGFDQSAGGCPSPILPDGRLLSLPIPASQGSKTRYRDLRGRPSTAALVEDLTRQCKRPVRRSDLAHLDPDLNHHTLERLENWLPAFGQTGSAQTHLQNQGVDVGDLFLFYGLYRQVHLHEGCWSFSRSDLKRHVIFGYMQVGEILRVGTNVTAFRRSHPHLASHPHLVASSKERNVIYVARRTLQLPGLPKTRIAGAGIFDNFRSELQLTKNGSKLCSIWELPGWFYPVNRTPLSYHGARIDEIWSLTRCGTTLLQSRSRGQEFVLDCDQYPEAIPWAYGIISRTANRRQVFQNEAVQ